MRVAAGAIVAGRYEVMDRIAEGGMSTVYRARRRDDDTIVALKILREQYAEDREFVERFAREARSAEALSHPNVVRVFESGRDGDIYYIAMEYVDGPDLRAYLKRFGRLDPADAQRIAISVCEALDYAHHEGIVHRDVKPQNILLAPDGTVKVADFGVARALAAVTITEPGVVMGTVQYMSPEQARGAGVGRASDIYALGVVLYEMLTGRLPFEGESHIAIALQHLHGVLPPPRSVQPDVPLRLEGIVMMAMAKRAEGRYQSAHEMSGDLAGKSELWKSLAVDDEGSTRRFDLGETQQPARRRASMLLPVGVVLAFALGVGIWIAWQAVSGYLNVPEVEMPELVGRTLPQAELIARQAGLTLEVTERAYDASAPQDTVVAQEQPAGRRLKRGRVVGVTVSLGARLVDVPDVTRRPVQEAQLILEEAGLKPGVLQEGHDDLVKPGSVIRQDPPAGSRVPADSQVSLLISRGPHVVEIPNLVGLSLAEARERLEELGVVITHIRTVATSEFPPGVVVEQAPAPATRMRPGSSPVIVTISARPGDESAPPNVPIITAEPQRVETPRPRPSPSPAPRASPTPPGAGPRPQPSAASGQPQPSASPAAPAVGAAKRTRIQVVVPEGGPQEVKIVVIDETGVRTAYQATHSPGDRVDQIVRSQGYTIVQVYIDRRLIQEVRP